MAKSLTWLLIGIVVVVVQGCDGCDGCSCGSKATRPPEATNTDEGSSAATAPTPRRIGNTAGAPPAVRPQRRRAIPVTAEEVTPLLPAIPRATLLGPAQRMPSGNQLRFSYCMDEPDVAAAAEAISTALQGGQWTEVRVRSNPRGAPRVAVGGKREDYRVNGQISPGTTPQCDGKQGKSLARLSVFKIGDAPAGEDDEARVIDPRGPGPRRVPRPPGAGAPNNADRLRVPRPAADLGGSDQGIAPRPVKTAPSGSPDALP